MRVFVIPDIHGHKAKLDHALDLIVAMGGCDAPVVFLGDLVDRGPDSRGVIDTVLSGLAAGRNWTVLRGNHDQLFLDQLTSADPAAAPAFRAWCSHRGGAATLASYGIDLSAGLPEAGTLARAVPRAHVEFLSAMPLWHQTDDLLIVHAGIRPGVPMPDQTPDDLMNMREPFHSDSRDYGRLVVHGHAAIDFPTHYGNRINLDGGAGWGRPLRPAVFDGRDCGLLTDDGAVVPLRP